MKKILILVALSFFSSSVFAQSNNPIFDRLMANAPKATVEQQKEYFDNYVEKIINFAPKCAAELTDYRNSKKKREPEYRFISSCSQYMMYNTSLYKLDSIENFKENSTRYNDMLIAEQSLTSVGFVNDDYNAAIDKANKNRENDKFQISTYGRINCVTVRSSGYTRCF